MAIYTLRSGATAHPEDTVMQFMTDLVSASGVISTSGTDLKAVERGAGANMSVDISAGRGYAKGSGNAYPIRNTAAINATITNNTSGNPRIDAVVLYIDLAETPTTTADDVVKTAVVAGTPAGSPSAPSDGTIQTAVGASNPFIRLANVAVAHNETAINTADITDARVQLTIQEAYITSGIQVNTITSSSTPTPILESQRNLFTVTALAAGATFAVPSGTPTDGMTLLIRIKDNGTARTLAYNAIYRALGVVLPTTTVVSKTIYLGCVYNSADTKWDVVAVQQEF